MTTLIRAGIFHTPRDPFAADDALECFDDGALAFADGRILTVGEHAAVARAHPDADLIDARDCFLLPGFVDTHVHWPQLGVIGTMGLELLDWLRLRTLPEEARLADPFSISCSEQMLESCGALASELDGALVTTHINESAEEVQAVADWFPWAGDYLETYERHGLVGPETVLAHNIHVTDDELTRLAVARASVANCPASNAFLGSGIFPMRRHLDSGVHFGLGTDVGAGTGLSMLEEGLTSYQSQMLAGQVRLAPAHLLWMATRAGALALGLGNTVGDLSPGREVDFVLLRPPEGSTLAAALARSDSPSAALGALITLAREESVVETRVAGEHVYTRDP